MNFETAFTVVGILVSVVWSYTIVKIIIDPAKRFYPKDVEEETDSEDSDSDEVFDVQAKDSDEYVVPDAAPYAVPEGVSDEVSDAVPAGVSDEVSDAVPKGVSDEVWDAVLDEVSDEVSDAVSDVEPDVGFFVGDLVES